MAEVCVVLRDEVGAVQTQTPVSVWSDRAGATLASLYSDRAMSLAVANPVSSDLDGLLHFFTSDASVWYTTALQITPLPLPTTNDSDTVNVKDYGAVGDGTTDDSAAILAAFNAILAHVLGSTISHWNRPVLYFPTGSYVLAPSTLQLPTDQWNRHWTICGDGENATEIIMTRRGAGPLFSFGDIDTAPTDAFQGSDLKQITIRDLTLTSHADDRWTARTTLREGIGIQDNGCGSISLDHVSLLGFKVGFYTPYGGDFNYARECQIGQCDVGIYLGPGSQQVKYDHCTIYYCHEGVVLRSTPEVHFNNCIFIDNSLGDVLFENNASVRYGVSYSGGYQDGMVTMDGCWFETGCSPLQYPTPSDQKGHIRLYGDRADLLYWRGLVIRDSIVVSGENDMATKDGGEQYGFLRAEDSMIFRRVKIENMTYIGGHKDYIVSVPAVTAASHRISVHNITTRDGYTAPKIFSQDTTSRRMKYSADWDSYFTVPCLNIVDPDSTVEELTEGVAVFASTIWPPGNQAAPTGSLGIYSTGGPRRTLWLKESSPTTTTGWKAVETVSVAVNGDVAKSLQFGHATAGDSVQLWTSPLTTDRAVTLQTTDVQNGSTFRIVRTAASTGVSNLNVGTGPLKALATGQWCEVTYDGSAWVLTAFGSL